MNETIQELRKAAGYLALGIAVAAVVSWWVFMPRHAKMEFTSPDQSMKDARPQIHTMTISEDAPECVSDNPLILARRKDIVMFVADAPNTRVDSLRARPVGAIDGEMGERLSAGPDRMELANGKRGAIVIARDALGIYELKLTCGNSKDEPPRIIVDGD